MVSLDDDPKIAKDRARPFIAMYLSLFPNLARETELDNALIARVRSVFESQGAEQAARLIDDSVVDSLTASGDAAEVRTRIDHYRAAGMRLPIVFPLGDAAGPVIEALSVS